MTTTETAPKTYRVPEQNVETLRARIGKINRRAARLGVPALVLNVGPADVIEGKRTNPDGSTVKTFKKVHPVTLSGEPPRVAGWTFAATIQHMGEAGNVLRKTPGYADIDLPARFRDAATDCDHCKAERRRTDTYVLAGDAGDWKQVGSTCLIDFLGHDPKHALGAAEILFSAADALGAAEDDDREGEHGYGGGSPRYFDLSEYLAFVSACVRALGWTSRGEARASMVGACATADAAVSAMFPVKSGPKLPSPDATDRETAARVVAWGEALSERTGLSDYMGNLAVVFRAGCLDYRLAGIAASAVPTYLREIEAEIKRATAAKTSRHVGTVGKRETFAGLTVVSARDFPSDFGVTTLVTFADAAGNVLKWWASNLPDALRNAEGKTFSVKATVKAHGDYKGVAETTLTRATLV
jgi:hypothetical protein